MTVSSQTRMMSQLLTMPSTTISPQVAMTTLLMREMRTDSNPTTMFMTNLIMTMTRTIMTKRISSRSMRMNPVSMARTSSLPTIMRIFNWVELLGSVQRSRLTSLTTEPLGNSVTISTTTWTSFPTSISELTIECKSNCKAARDHVPGQSSPPTLAHNQYP